MRRVSRDAVVDGRSLAKMEVGRAGTLSKDFERGDRKCA